MSTKTAPLTATLACLIALPTMAFADDAKQAFEQGKATLSAEIMQYLTQWLIGHIKGSDKQYVDLFLEKGVK